MNSIISNDIPDNEDEEAAPAKRRHFNWSPPAWLTSLSSLQHENTIPFPHDWWTSWFCQLAIPALSDFQRLCACGTFFLDAYRDHSHVLPTQWHHQRCTRAHPFCSRHHVQAQRLHHPTQERHFQPANFASAQDSKDSSILHTSDGKQIALRFEDNMRRLPMWSKPVRQ
jgi:hypothetical protein